MKQKTNQPGKKMSDAAMKKLLGAGLPGADPRRCIAIGSPCGGGGCDDPEPVCCNGGRCTGSNGIISNPGFCVLGDYDGEVM